jgi:hypothetical protein
LGSKKGTIWRYAKALLLSKKAWSQEKPVNQNLKAGILLEPTKLGEGKCPTHAILSYLKGERETEECE